MKNVSRSAGSHAVCETTIEADVTGADRVAAPRSGSMIEGGDRARMDSIIIALLEDIARSKEVDTFCHVAYRVGPLGREELNWNACEDDIEERNAQEIATSIGHHVALGSGLLPPDKQRFATTDPEISGRIVIAEDDEATRMLLDRVLTRAGFTVHACANGQLACEAVRREGADVVLLDWMMPVMDGPTAVVHLKTNLDTRGIPVVMLTSQSDIDERVVALNGGVQDFLTKPFDTRELVARIGQQLRWRRMLAVDANTAFSGQQLKQYGRLEPDSAVRTDGKFLPSFFDRIWGNSPKAWAPDRAA